MKRLNFLFVIAVVMVCLTSPALAQKKPIQLKAVQFVNFRNPGESGFHLLVDMINKAAMGELVIKIAGGPESIPGRQQPEAVRTGAVDIAFVPAPWYKSMVPIGGLMNLRLLDPWEERKTGFYDFVVEEHEKAGLRYIGNAHCLGTFFLYSKEPIYSLEGLKGKRFRHSPAYPFFTALGIKPITAAHSEIYAGLERHVFDGLAINHTNFIDLHLYEVCKYIVGPTFFHHTTAAVIMNLGKFNSLPNHLQELILQSMEKAEPLIKEKENEIDAKNWKTLEAKGMKHIKWSPEDNKTFLDIVTQVTWEVEGKKLKPGVGDKMKKMMGY